MTHSISVENPAETIDALSDLADAAELLEQSARAAKMPSTARECNKVKRQLWSCSHRLQADTISVDACLAYIEVATDRLDTFAVRIGEAARAR